MHMPVPVDHTQL